ncbi:hypothetical protein HJFPF1_08911 [Paramyrothecium foliicola]|nr:hypothetical protein HJFPF1_08911 [Paramyrothecium foliicola]
MPFGERATLLNNKASLPVSRERHSSRRLDAATLTLVRADIVVTGMAVRVLLQQPREIGVVTRARERRPRLSASVRQENEEEVTRASPFDGLVARLSEFLPEQPFSATNLTSKFLSRFQIATATIVAVQRNSLTSRNHGQERYNQLRITDDVCELFVTDQLSTLAKTRLINVRLISMAMTGFFYTFKRPRTSPLMGMMKYDPIGTSTTILKTAKIN